MSTTYKFEGPTLEAFVTYDERRRAIIERMDTARATLTTLNEQALAWQAEMQEAAGQLGDLVKEAAMHAIQMAAPETDLMKSDVAINLAYVREHGVAYLTVTTLADNEAKDAAARKRAGAPRVGGPHVFN